jgi:hypothetical protein
MIRIIRYIQIMGTKLEFQFALTIPGDIWMFFFEASLEIFYPLESKYVYLNRNWNWVAFLFSIVSAYYFFHFPESVRQNPEQVHFIFWSNYGSSYFSFMGQLLESAWELAEQ